MSNTRRERFKQTQAEKKEAAKKAEFHKNFIRQLSRLQEEGKVKVQVNKPAQVKS